MRHHLRLSPSSRHALRGFLRVTCAVLSTAWVTGSALAATTTVPDPLPALPRFKLVPDSTTVSGLSSGAFMAVQLQVAYSASIQGAGVIAGGPYYCAAGQLAYAGICMGQVPLMPPNPALMLGAAKQFAALGQIDALKNLAKRRLYAFHGTADSVVGRSSTDSMVAFFRQAGMPAAQLQYVNTLPAGHAVITPGSGNACDANAAPYISHCDLNGQGYDQAEALLTHLLGPLQARANTSASTPSEQGQLQRFSQKPYTNASAAMAAEGYLYVPNSCAAGQPCKVHVALHGCQQSAEKVGLKFVTETGYNAWADTNHLLVLYPQVNAATVPFNPKGCWDWWGYTGVNYAKRSGPQMKAIKAMVDALALPR